MSRELLLMRHAKSSWKGGFSDHERPLNRRGRLSAVRIGVELEARQWVPDMVMCSDAERTRETLEWVEDALGRSLPSTHTSRLYLPSVVEMCRVIAGARSTIGRLMVISHNPTCEELVTYLTGAREQVTTANVMRITFDATDWRSAVASARTGQLVDVLRPRDLDPHDPLIGR